ncbi:C40 family peptidase [Gorillibacterium timonense]|uniref:C40 family peptidase n=1 Tax=Gorillibacterium timonense TaxID=1689269 RepID=UPI00071D641C|nr:NlpC/P60 family protein [Gorillibacterium timonense]
MLSSAVFASGLLFVQQSEAASSPVKVQINDTIVSFPDAQPFVDSNSRTQIPVRVVSEKMGYSVTSIDEGKQVKVTISGKNRTIILKTGEQTATVNGETISLDTKALISKNRTYVPLRFISESFGTEVNWDSKTQLAIVNADGKDHAPAIKAESSAALLVANSKKYLGIPYMWGGSTPSGFDCSGFVAYLLNQQKVTVPRTADGMRANTGTSVFQPQPGDLVFFSNTQKAPANHVGIYIGSGKFISATNSNGIHIDPLTTGYWGNRYFTAKRVFSS